MPLLSLPRGFRHYLLPFLMVALAPLVGGCELINPDEQVPAYLRIAPFAYSPAMTNAPITTQGSYSGDGSRPHDPNGPDAWVYVDSKLLGVFEPPVTVPVLKAGSAKVTILPGIYADGQKGARLVYPFYKGYSETLNFQPKEVTNVTPPTFFDAAVTRPFDDDITTDFNSSNTADVKFSLPSTSIYRLENNVRTDPAGLSLQIPAAFGGVGLVRGIEGKTDQFFLDSDYYGILPQKGAPVYVELDYRSTIPFKVGVGWSLSPNRSGAVFNRSADLTVYPKETWTKLYVNLTDEISYVNNTAARFIIFIQGQPNGTAGDYLAIDNIRLVRRN